MLIGGWQSHHDLIPDASSNWSGSACAYQVANGHLYMVTNRHCLGLDELATSALDGEPVVPQYGLSIRFTSGQERAVLRFGFPAAGIDVAIVEVDASGLEAGRDYILLPYGRVPELQAGDEVVAVGSPKGLEGTQTFGRISALRAEDVSGARITFVQTDAAINHGNSGGPLFIKQGDRYTWIGINTAKFDGADNLGFAIRVDALNATQYYFYPADKFGAAQALTERYRVRASAR